MPDLLKTPETPNNEEQEARDILFEAVANVQTEGVSIFDSTSVQEISVVSTEQTLLSDDGDEVLDQVTDLLAQPKPEDDQRETRLQQCKELLLQYYVEVNKAQNRTEATFAHHALRIGQLLNSMKPLVKATKAKWQEWATANLPYLRSSTREDYMLLAKRKDAHKYLYLGKDRLMELIRATKGSDEDPIGTFMDKYAIDYDEEEAGSFKEFKLKVDTALNMARLAKFGFDAPRDQVEKLTANNIKLNKKVIDHLGFAKNAGGTFEKALKKLVENNGKIQTAPADNEETVLDFNQLSANLIEAIEQLVTSEEEDLNARVNEDTLNRLIEKIERLKEALKA